MLKWLLFAGIGKVLIYFWKKFPLPAKIEKINNIKQLHECDMCSGFWIYTTLAFLMSVNLLELWFGFGYIVMLSEIITGCVTSYVVHLLSVGFSEQHLNVTVI